MGVKINTHVNGTKKIIVCMNQQFNIYSRYKLVPSMPSVSTRSYEGREWSSRLESLDKERFVEASKMAKGVGMNRIVH